MRAAPPARISYASQVQGGTPIALKLRPCNSQLPSRRAAGPLGQQPRAPSLARRLALPADAPASHSARHAPRQQRPPSRRRAWPPGWRRQASTVASRRRRPVPPAWSAPVPSSPASSCLRCQRRPGSRQRRLRSATLGSICKGAAAAGAHGGMGRCRRWCLAWLNAPLPLLMRAVCPACRLEPWLAVALFLLHERAKGGASRWAPYLAALPADSGSPVQWGEEDLAELRGSQALQTAMAYRCSWVAPARGAAGVPGRGPGGVLGFAVRCRRSCCWHPAPMGRHAPSHAAGPTRLPQFLLRRAYFQQRYGQLQAELFAPNPQAFDPAGACQAPRQG